MRIQKHFSRISKQYREKSSESQFNASYELQSVLRPSGSPAPPTWDGAGSSLIREFRGLPRLIFSSCIVLLVLTLLTCGCGHRKYRSGRDTVKSFGDGRFQILRVVTKTSEYLVLDDVELNKKIAREVLGWKHKGPFVYAIAKEPRYVIINLDSANVIQENDLSSIPQPHQSILESLEND